MIVAPVRDFGGRGEGRGRIYCRARLDSRLTGASLAYLGHSI